MITTNEKSKIVDSFSLINDKILDIFNPLKIVLKYYKVRSEQVNIELRELMKEVKVLVENLKISETIIFEIDNTISIIQDEVILKYKNQSLNKYTKDAINIGAATLNNQLTILKAEYLGILKNEKSKIKSKYPDVLISENEFSLFIILAQKYGLISRNHVSNEDRASAFSTLTNISENTIRQNTSSTYYLKPQKLILKSDNLTVLMQTLLNIYKEIGQINDNLKF